MLLCDICENALIVYKSGKDTLTYCLKHILPVHPNTMRLDIAAHTMLAIPPTTNGDFPLQSPYNSDMPLLLSNIQLINGGLDILSESDLVPVLEPGHKYHHHSCHHHCLSNLEGETALLSDITSDVDADVEAGSMQGGDGGGSDLEQATATLSLLNGDEMPWLALL